MNKNNSYKQSLSKYIVAFQYFGNTFIVLSATSEGIFIISLTSLTGAPVAIVSAIFILLFSFTTGVIKKLLKITRTKTKKYNKSFTLAKSKLNSIEKLLSQALIDFEISPEEFRTIINEEENYKRFKEVIRMMKNSY